jgi:hypothetical protein
MNAASASACPGQSFLPEGLKFLAGIADRQFMRLSVDFSAEPSTTEQGKPAARRGRKVSGLDICTHNGIRDSGAAGHFRSRALSPFSGRPAADTAR